GAGLPAGCVGAASASHRNIEWIHRFSRNHSGPRGQPPRSGQRRAFLLSWNCARACAMARYDFMSLMPALMPGGGPDMHSRALPAAVLIGFVLAATGGGCTAWTADGKKAKDRERGLAYFQNQQ